MRDKSGFTIIEAMIVTAVLTAVFFIAGSALFDLMRVSNREQALLQMDQDANRILETVKHTLRSAYVPFAEKPLNSGTGRFEAVSLTDLGRNVDRWRDVLENGADLLVFLVGVDAENDGDIMYGNSEGSKRLILGIEGPAGIVEATDENDTLANLGIVDLDPKDHLDLPDDNSSPIDLTAARFNHRFAFPAAGSRRQIYGVIRFAPMRENGAAGSIVTLRESQLGVDLNDDGDTSDEFALGHIEIVYPDGAGDVFTQSLSSDSVLMQINRDDADPDSLFRLWPPGGGGNSIKVHLLLCNYAEQQSPWAFSRGGFQVITRAYDTVVKMQLMSLQ